MKVASSFLVAICIAATGLMIMGSEGPSDDFFGVFDKGSWWKYMMRPELYLRKIARHFDLDEEKFLDRIGLHNIRKPHAFSEPFLFSLNINERIFERDVCLKTYYCTIQSYVEKHYDLLSPTTKENLEISYVKDYFEGCKDDEVEKPRCQPVLTPYYSELTRDLW